MAGYIGTKASVVTPGAERKKVFDITGATTTLTGLDYTPNFVHVYHNGVRLVDGTDYTATNGTSITLTVAAQNGDEVVVISYATFKAADAYTKAESDDRYVNVAGDTMTGALTIGGDLTVDTDTLYVDSTNNRVGIGTTSPDGQLHVYTDAASSLIRVTSSTTGVAGIDLGDTGAVDRGQIRYFNDGDYLVLSTSATQRMRITSTGNVGIGVTNPAVELDVNGNIRAQRSGDARLYLNNGSTQHSIENISGALVFKEDGSEAMRIDSSGNLLVGKTTTSSNTAGMLIGANGRFDAVRDGGYVGYFNRKTSDGDIALFAKDDTFVGSVGVDVGDLTIYSTTASHAGLKFGNTVILPTDNTGSNADNAMSLGVAGTRFKDLYLSGGVYLGGTGGANYLHDYEEGTYTALLTTGAGSITLNSSYNTLAYTKIGRQVTITGRVRVSSISSPSGNVQINLPFTSSNQTEEAGRAYFHLALYDVDLPDTNNFSVFAECGELANVATFIYARDSVPWEILPASGFKSSSFFYFGGTYITDS